MTESTAPSATIAVVDDVPEQRRLIRQALEEAGYRVREGGNGREAVELAAAPLDAMILDVRMPELDGLEALRQIKQARPELIVILLTAYIDLRDAVDAIKTGAHDYLEKPIDLDELVVAVDDALGTARESTTAPRSGLDLPDAIVALSAETEAVFREAARVAPTGATVLLLGESGTGKEVLAQFLHERSPRAERPFVAVNCAALPETLIESELFGHERGAFTGAVATRPGCFERADGGTLLLDEIGEMPLALQAKLLRVLEDGLVRHVGGTKEIFVDARIITATNRPLEADAEAGRFRQDLLYRLNVITLRVPPLRERREDILALADRFLAAQELGAKRFSPAARRLLIEYPWPGNVRELRNAVVRAGIMSHGAVILPDDLPESIRECSAAAAAAEGAGVLTGSMEDIQKRAILEALEKTSGNKTQAAKQLGISRRNLIYKLRSYGL